MTPPVSGGVPEIWDWHNASTGEGDRFDAERYIAVSKGSGARYRECYRMSCALAATSLCVILNLCTILNREATNVVSAQV